MTPLSIRLTPRILSLAIAVPFLLAVPWAEAEPPKLPDAQPAPAAPGPNKVGSKSVPSKPAPRPPAPGDSPVGDKEEAAPPIKQTRRYLVLKNQTAGKLTVFLQYRTETNKGAWQWFPGDPRTSTEALRFDLKPGQETYLEDEGWTINASRVRIWAVAESGKEWNDYKTKELWLVPEADKAGKHVYLAAEMGSHTLPFGP